MSELETKYRAAPRQHSPDRLDSLILARAGQKLPAKGRSTLMMSPWKTAVASFCVAGFGVALLLRFGVPPLDWRSSATLDSVDGADSVQSDSAQSEVIADLQDNAVVTTASDEVAPVLNQRQVADLDQTESASIRKTERSAREDLTVTKDLLAEAVSVDRVTDKAKSISPKVTALPVETARVAPPLPLELAQPVVNEVATVVPEVGVAIAQNNEVIAEENEPNSQSAPLGTLSTEDESSEPAVVTRAPALSSHLSAAGTQGVDEIELGKQRSLKQRAAGNQVQEKQMRAESALVAIQPGPNAVDAARWITEQSTFHFTLQLATAPDAGYLLELGRLLDLKQAWYVVDLSDTQSGESFGLLYGVFENADQALKHINALDKKTTKIRPQVRSFNELRSELKQP